MSFTTILFRVLLVLACAVAFKWGGRAERAVAVLYLIATILSHLAYVKTKFDFDRIVVPLVVIDLALLIGLLVVSTRFKRWWLILASAMQLLTCLGHTAKALDPVSTTAMGYFMMLVSSSYPAVILLMIGVWQHHRTMRIRSSSGSLRRADRRPRS